MKFPSIKRLATGAFNVVKRFPLEILSSITGTIASLMLLDLGIGFQEKEYFLVRLALSSLLALCLFLSVTLFSEARKLSAAKHWLLKLAACLVIVLIFFLLIPLNNEITVFRFGFLAVSFHLLVSFAPFIGSKNTPAFWEFNKQLFLRILASALYSGVLFAGLAIALLSVDALFNIKIDGKLFVRLWIVILGVFNTIFFLAGVPSDWQQVDSEQSYPKGLKVFTQYVLIPLATVYLGILLAYEFKIISEWSLPKGMVTWLVIGYALYGILSILLIHPIREQEGNRWTRVFSRLFYILLIPLIALLMVAIWVRVKDYGITESRYIIIELGLWLAGLTIYFLARGDHNIKVIPASLCVIALLSTWGPQGAPAVSEWSQTKRLVNIFETAHAYENGKFSPIKDAPKQASDAYSLVDHIVERYGVDGLVPYFSFNIDSIRNDSMIYSDYERKREVVRLIAAKLNLTYFSDYAGNDYYSINSSLDTLPVSGFRMMVNLDYSEDRDSIYDKNGQRLLLKTPAKIYAFPFKAFCDSIIKSPTGTTHYMEVQPGKAIIESEQGDARMFIRDLSFSMKDSLKLITCSASVLLK